MESSNTVGGLILAGVIIAGAGYLVLNVKSDRAKFDELKIGMTRSEVQAIVGPKSSGGVRQFRSYNDIGDNEILDINDVMELTIRNGRLVAKRWLKKDKGS
jgi:hypothetical protein